MPPRRTTMSVSETGRSARESSENDDWDVDYVFTTKRTFELLEREEPFLERQFKQLAAAGAEQMTNLQEDVKEMLEPVANELEPCVDCIKDIVQLDWMPLLLGKHHTRVMVGPLPPSSLAAAAARKPSLGAATVSPATESKVETQTLSSKESKASDGVSKATPPRSNLTNSNGGIGGRGGKKKKSVSFRHPRRAIPGRESPDQVKRRLMKQYKQKTVFDRFTEAEVEIEAERVKMEDTKVFLVPQAPQSTQAHQLPQPPQTVPVEQKETSLDKENRADDATTAIFSAITSAFTAATTPAPDNDTAAPTTVINGDVKKQDDNKNYSEVVDKENANVDTLPNEKQNHIPSGTRPESPIRLLSFQDVDDDNLDDKGDEEEPEPEVIVLDDFDEEGAVGVAESIIAAAESAIAAAGNKINSGITTSFGRLEEVRCDGMESDGEGGLTSPNAPPTRSSTVEHMVERREPLSSGQIERDGPLGGAISLRDTNDGEREPADSSEPLEDVKEEKSFRLQSGAAFPRSFLDAVQSSAEFENTEHKPGGYMKLLPRRLPSDSGGEDSDTSTHLSNTTSSRGSSMLHSTDVSRHSRHSILSNESSRAYLTDTSMLYSAKGGHSSSIGNSSSMETTDREGSTDEEFAPSRHEWRPKLEQQGLPPYRTRPLLPPRFRPAAKML